MLRECPDSASLRRHFRIEVHRTQRRSDGTITVDGVRFEVPQVFAHLRQLSVRYARWDRSQVDLVDPRTGVIQATVYPLDKARNADGQRAPKPSLIEAPATPPASGMAPLLQKILRQYATTGLPPAYLPKDDLPPIPPSHE